MKFISWNVNGLRAALNKGFNDIFSDIDADFFCLQETKLQEGQTDFAPDGYSSYWNYAEKKGYSGVAIFSRHTPLSVTKGIGIPGHDNEGRVLTLEFAQFYLVTVYTPNSQDGLRRLDYRGEWDEAFRAYVMSLDKAKPVIICGDLNVAHKEIDLKNPKTTERIQDLPMRNAMRSPDCWTAASLTHSAISSLTPPMHTHGGATVSVHVRRTPDGASTIS